MASLRGNIRSLSGNRSSFRPGAQISLEAEGVDGAPFPRLSGGGNMDYGYEYRWSINGQQQKGSRGGRKTFRHTFIQPGDYVFTCFIYDSEGNNVAVSERVRVEDAYGVGTPNPGADSGGGNDGDYLPAGSPQIPFTPQQAPGNPAPPPPPVTPPSAPPTPSSAAPPSAPSAPPPVTPPPAGGGGSGGTTPSGFGITLTVSNRRPAEGEDVFVQVNTIGGRARIIRITARDSQGREITRTGHQVLFSFQAAGPVTITGLAFDSRSGARATATETITVAGATQPGTQPATPTGTPTGMPTPSGAAPSPGAFPNSMMQMVGMDAALNAMQMFLPRSLHPLGSAAAMAMVMQQSRMQAGLDTTGRFGRMAARFQGGYSAGYEGMASEGEIASAQRASDAARARAEAAQRRADELESQHGARDARAQGARRRANAAHADAQEADDALQQTRQRATDAQDTMGNVAQVSWWRRMLNPVAGTAGANQSGFFGRVGGAVGGWLGQVSSNAGGGAAGAAAVQSTLATSAVLVAATVNNVRLASNYGGEFVDHLSRGVRSALNTAFTTGAQFGETLLGAILKPFGQSGQAIAKTFGTVMQSTGHIVDTAIGLGTQVARIAGQLGGAAIALGGAAVGGAIGAIWGPMGAIVGAAVGSLLGVLITRVMDMLANAVGTLFQTLGSLVGEFGQVAVQVFQTVATVLQEATESALRYAKAVASIHYETGGSIANAQEKVRTLGAFGVSPEQAAQIYSGMGQNQMYQDLRNSYLGLGANATEEQKIRALRARRSEYGATMDPAMATMMIQHDMGMTNNRHLRDAVMMPNEDFERTIGLVNQLRSAVPDEMIEKWSAGFQTLLNTFNMVVDAIRASIGTAFLPVIQSTLEKSVKWFIAHRDQIIKTVVDIGRWFYVDLPEYVLQGVHMIIGFISLIAGGIANVMDAMANWVDGLASVYGTNEHLFIMMLRWIDNLILAFRTMAAVGVAAFVAIGVAQVAAATGVGAVVAVPLGLAAGVAAYAGMMAGTASFQTDLAGQAQKAGLTGPTLGQTSAGLRSGAKWLRDNIVDPTQSRQDWVDHQARGIIGTKDERADTYQKEIVNKLGQLVQQGQQPLQVDLNVRAEISPRENFFEAVLAYQARAQWNAARRSV